MKIEEKNFKTYSMIGSRATFGLIILELAKKNKNIIAISADTSTSAGLDRLKKQLPNNFWMLEFLNKILLVLLQVYPRKVLMFLQQLLLLFKQ